MLIFLLAPIPSLYFLNCSGVRRHCILARIKNNARHRYNHCALANPMFWSPQIWPDVVSTCKMSVWLSTSRWLAPLKPTCIVLVGCFYLFKSDIEFYLSSLGRTGRAGKLGTAITFLTNDDDEVMCVCLFFILSILLIAHSS